MNKVINEPAISQNIIVNPNHAQNGSCSARGKTHRTVVTVVTIIGCSRDLPAATRDSM